MAGKLWVDKHRPLRLKHMTYHTDLSTQLAALKKCGDFPHLLFYGPSGAGKKTRAMAFLRELFGEAAIEKLRFENMELKAPSGAKIELRALASNYHIDVTPSDCGYYDRVVIQEVIKNLASSCRLDTRSDGSQRFKVVIMNEVDKLTKDAQHALRRTMEKYVASCRLILICQSTSKVIPAIKSRCLGIRIPSPTHEEMLTVLKKVAKKEGLVLPADLATRIVEKSDRNMRRALLMLEATRVRQYPFQEGQPIPDLPWQVYIKDTAKLVLMEFSHERLMKIRDMLYELQVHLIPSQIIFKGLVDEITASVPGALKPEVIRLAANCEHRMQLGSKEIFHLEAFVISFMSVHQQYTERGILEQLDFSSDMEMD